MKISSSYPLPPRHGTPPLALLLAAALTLPSCRAQDDPKPDGTIRIGGQDVPVVFAERTGESLRKTIIEDIERIYVYAPTVEVLPNPPGAQQPVVVRGSTLRYTHFLDFPKGKLKAPNALKDFGEMVDLHGQPCLVVEERHVEAYKQALAMARKHREMMAKVKPTIELLSAFERLMALPFEAKRALFHEARDKPLPSDRDKYYDRELRYLFAEYTMMEPSILSFRELDLQGVRVWLFETVMKPRDPAKPYTVEGLVYLDGRWGFPAFIKY